MKRTSMVAAAIGAVAVLGVGGTALAGSAPAGSAPAGSAPAGTSGLATDDDGADAVVSPRATGDDFGLRGDGTIDDDPVAPAVSPTSRSGFGEATSPAPAVSADRHGGRATADDNDHDRHGGGDDRGRR